MTHYVPAYDAEAIYPWWEVLDKPYSAELYKELVRYEGPALDECLAGIRAVAEIHIEHNAPATFFLVGELVAHAAQALREILDHPIFDIQCHSYTHADFLEIADDAAALTHELTDSKRLIEDTFGRPVIGITTPGAFSDGLRGQPRVLEALWDAGYRFVRSVGKGPFDSLPAPLTQPFWYKEDGYADLLELGLHAWHDNVLTGQPFLCHWPPTLPWGYPTHVPETPEQVYEAYAPGIDYAAQHRLTTYIPCLHPWSIYRVDKKAGHIGLLLAHARERVTIGSCVQVYDKLKKAKRTRPDRK